MSRATSWRVALRLARRDALRARGRSLLVLLMIALPVLAVTAADVVMRTSDVDGVESLDRKLGSAQAEVVATTGRRSVVQAFDPDAGFTTGNARRPARLTAKSVAAALGGARLLEERRGGIDVGTDRGVGYAEALEVDLRDPLTDGLVRLRSGRLPDEQGEVVVNQALLDKGYAVGDRLDLADGPGSGPTIVGVAESAAVRDYPFVAGPLGTIGIEETTQPSWLVGGAPVDWDTVRELNALGASVLSRAVVTDPPPDSELPAEIQAWNTGTDDAVVAVVVLVVVMALLEVVLLAGPAFAVSARRQSRSLALMAAAGGTPAQSRRVVLAGAVVLGGVAAVAGVGLGIAAGWALLPLVQRWSSSWFGPFDVPWLHLVGVAGFGLLSALLAAVVPAWIASRQDVVAVLAGRRADRPASLRSPVLGVLLLGAGVAGAAYGATSSQNGELAIAGSAVLAVLGMILLVPLVVVVLARVSARLPLTVRYAVRDAARHRSRTVPAVAAVAATVAGVVALGIATSSDAAENEGNYVATLPMGEGSVTAYGATGDWDGLERAVRDAVPAAEVTRVDGVVESAPFDDPRARYYYVDLHVPGERTLLGEYMSALGTSVLVGRELPAVVRGVDDADRARADRVLAEGGAVVFSDHDVDADEVVLRPSWGDSRRSHRMDPATVPATFVRLPAASATAAAVLPPGLTRRIGVETSTVSIAVTGATISAQQEQDVSEAVTAVNREATFYVERGFQADDEAVIVQLVLGGLGAVLMLGGTLTATFLALSDARPDLATLSAVGASPRRRRGIAASYAIVVGLVGALLGAIVGLIPGIAVSYPLTRGYGTSDTHYLDVPWLLIVSLVLGLPLVTAAIVGLSARSRLPLVSRLG